MNKRHSITETRDWSKIILMVGLALSFVIVAVRGDLSGAALAAIVGAFGLFKH